MNNTKSIQVIKQHQQELITFLKNALVEVDEMWDEEYDHATIVGYLQSTIKVVTRELEESISK